MAKCTNVTYLMHEKADAPGTFEKLIDITAVSYTHLTLPTSDLV
mgnify:CR=1 FL=1